MQALKLAVRPKLTEEQNESLIKDRTSQELLKEKAKTEQKGKGNPYLVE